MPKAVCVLLAASLPCFAASAAVNPAPITPDQPPKIILPQDGDEYAKLVAQAAANDPSVDFRALRFAYLKSAARKRNGGPFAGSDMKERMFAAAKAGDDAGVRSAAEGLLSLNYSDVAAQTLLSLACRQLHDSACAAQAHFMARGLIKSIMDGGDGKTCKTGWEVAAIGEEYFVLNLLGVAPKQQSLVTGSPSCDVLETTDKDGKSAAYFFRIDAVLADEVENLRRK